MPVIERAVWGILLMITLSKSTKLNVPKLLLPLSTRVPVNITLTAQRGYYKCSLLLAEQQNSKNLVMTSSPGWKHVTSPIPVLVTGHILRCDVIINRIESIQVVTTLSVRAFDSEGNTFSCLAGLKCNWRLAKESDAIQAVRFVRHHDAGYAPPPHILSLEDAGQRWESVLLYGIHSGSALIKVSFLHPEHKLCCYRNNILYCNNISVYYCVCYIFNQINALLLSIRDSNIKNLADPQGRHALIIFEGARVVCVCVDGGHHATHSSHNSPYVLFIFSFLFETSPNALTIS
uniref:NUP210 Ig-like domain-containing protein n=1 Tax=Sinocyclocheilus rhinocerous TaxID=307959 RepID=A0A673GQB8_9TELE